jgi:hypothetical protein
MQKSAVADRWKKQSANSRRLPDRVVDRFYEGFPEEYWSDIQDN